MAPNNFNIEIIAERCRIMLIDSRVRAEYSRIWVWGTVLVSLAAVFGTLAKVSTKLIISNQFLQVRTWLLAAEQ